MNEDKTTSGVTRHILHLEDSPEDAELLRALLEDEDLSCEVTTVTSQEAYLAAIADSQYDIVISDFALPGYNGKAALRDLRRLHLHTPFILFSGQLGEEPAIDCLKSGAWDYVLKDRPERLASSVSRALEEQILRARQREMEEALRESERRLSQIAEQSLAAILMVQDHHVVFANHYCAQLTGISVEDLVGTHEEVLLGCIAEEQRPRMRDLAKTLGRQGDLAHHQDLIQFRCPDGTKVWMHTSAARFQSHGREAFALVAVDVTALKTAELANSTWGAAIRSAGEGFEVTDKKGIIQDVNPALVRDSGYEREELIGHHVRILGSGQHSREFFQELWETITSGSIWSGRLTNRRKNGDLYRVETTISPVFNDHGAIENYVAVKRDITDQEALEERLLQAQKMQAIGTLAGGIAHDFNNILNAILGYTDLALDELPEGSPVAEDLEQVTRAGFRARELVNQLLTFSRRSERVYEILDLRSLVCETVSLLRAVIPANIEISAWYAEDYLGVIGDPTQLHQLVLNVCTNARDALAETGGRIAISLEGVTLSKSTSCIGGTMKPGEYAMLTISDTGPGIPLELQQRIFEPFFTTKAPGKGTGMGLAIVHGVIESHQGHTVLQSDSESGTTWQFYLPRVSEQATDGTEVAQDLCMGTEHILIVDDEEWLARLTERMLAGMGYRVSRFQDSREALEAFLAQPDQYDLILTDQTMPGLTGNQLTEQAKRIRPDLPVIIQTGFSETLTMDSATASGAAALLQKPVSRQHLSQEIRRVLEEG